MWAFKGQVQENNTHTNVGMDSSLVIHLQHFMFLLR